MTKGMVVLLLSMSMLTTGAQQNSSLSKDALAAKQKVERLAPDDKISVIPVQMPEEFGRFVSRDQDGFTFYDVDRKTNVTLRYTQIRKIKDGYGGYNTVQGRHTDRKKAYVIVAVVAIGLAVVVGAAIAAR